MHICKHVVLLEQIHLMHINHFWLNNHDGARLSLTIDRIHFRNAVLTVRATRDAVEIRGDGDAETAVRLQLPPGWRVEGAAGEAAGTPVTLGRGRTITCRRAG